MSRAKEVLKLIREQQKYDVVAKETYKGVKYSIFKYEDGTFVMFIDGTQDNGGSYGGGEWSIEVKDKAAGDKEAHRLIDKYSKRESSGPLVKVGDKVKCLPQIPITTQFKGVGTVISVNKMTTVTPAYEVEVKTNDGEIIRTQDKFLEVL